MSQTVRRGASGGWKRLLVMLVVTLSAVTVAITVAVAVAEPADSASRARISVSPKAAVPGASVSTTGYGFLKRARGKISFGGKVVSTFTTSGSGRFSKRWKVPAGASSGTVMARTSSRRASATLRVQVPTPPPPPVEGQRWSDPATWNGSVPQSGDTVTVPAGKIIVLDTSPPRLQGLQIDGTLLFEDKNLTLTSDWIMVHGKLQIGTEAKPFQSNARISLTGADKSQNIMNMGAKALSVMGGDLEVHGQSRTGWTKLGATATKDSNKLTLATTPGWRAGDKIVVSSTDYDPAQAEERTITAVSGDTVTLDKPLAYTHWGTLQTIDGKPVDERAEVALLSRNIVIEGEEASSVDGFGGQIMVMSGGEARIEGAELTRMGQKNTLRRYPLHFHMLGDGGAGSYLKNSSIHGTFNRCVTVHGTNRLDISGNVCHDHIGHGFFFEDGAETDNVLVNNLGLTTRRPAEGERLLPSDDSPSTFWITNPDNIVRNNVAAGSQGKGFWLAYPQHPTGLSTNQNIWPRRTPLGEFSDNVAHSNDGDGLHVDGGPRPDGTTEASFYAPRQNPAADSPPVVANFESFIGYKNRQEAVWLRGRDHILSGATLADNGIGATFASEKSFLRDSLVVGETANKGNPRSWETTGEDGRSLPRYWNKDFPIRGYEFYDGRVGAQNTTFANFTSNEQRRASGMGVLIEDAFALHPRNFASSIRFVNSDRVYLPGPAAGKDGDNSAVFIDEDGSVTGTAGSVVTANNPFLVNESCSLRTEWNAYVCPPGTEHVSLIADALEGPAAIKPLNVTREADDKSQTLMGCCDDSTEAITNLFPNQDYAVAFNGETPSRLRFVLYNGSDRWLQLSFSYPVEPKVTRWACDLAGGNPDGNDWCGPGKKESLDALRAYSGSGYYYDPAAKRLYLKIITGPDYEYNELRVEPGNATQQ